MPLKSIRAWLGADALEKHEFAPLRETLEGEIYRIAKELRVDHPDVVALRIAHQRRLPGMSRE